MGCFLPKRPRSCCQNVLPFLGFVVVGLLDLKKSKKPMVCYGGLLAFLKEAGHFFGGDHLHSEGVAACLG